jgi:hypothetical protein
MNQFVEFKDFENNYIKINVLKHRKNLNLHFIDNIIYIKYQTFNLSFNINCEMQDLEYLNDGLNMIKNGKIKTCFFNHNEEIISLKFFIDEIQNITIFTEINNDKKNLKFSLEFLLSNIDDVIIKLRNIIEYPVIDK